MRHVSMHTMTSTLALANEGGEYAASSHVASYGSCLAGRCDMAGSDIFIVAFARSCRLLLLHMGVETSESVPEDIVDDYD